MYGDNRVATGAGRAAGRSVLLISPEREASPPRRATCLEAEVGARGQPGRSLGCVRCREGKAVPGKRLGSVGCRVLSGVLSLSGARPWVI